MTGTKAGAQKAKATIKLKYGEDHYQRIGRIGGKVLTPTGGFASEKIGEDGLSGRQRAKIAGAKGGSISKRGPAKPKVAQYAN